MKIKSKLYGNKKEVNIIALFEDIALVEIIENKNYVVAIGVQKEEDNEDIIISWDQGLYFFSRGESRQQFIKEVNDMR